MLFNAKPCGARDRFQPPHILVGLVTKITFMKAAGRGYRLTTIFILSLMRAQLFKKILCSLPESSAIKAGIITNNLCVIKDEREFRRNP